jgi:Transglutaminase-like superfamily
MPTLADAKLEPRSLDELLSIPVEDIGAVDIGRTNLLCAEGLPNSDENEFPGYVTQLDTIAEGVQRYTERSWRLFKLKPAQFHNSENVFRVYTMEHVFRVQFGIRYDRKVRELTENGSRHNTTDSSEVFIHGILGPKRTGTCSSLPTFAIAVGRRLGYPLKLVLVPNHTLYRWDDGEEVFNLQHTEAGGEVKPDEYFYKWPCTWTEDDFATNARTKVWLHSLTPPKEVSKFLCNRALVLRECGRYEAAFQALNAAERFDPINPAVDAIRWHTLTICGGSRCPTSALPPVTVAQELSPNDVYSNLEVDTMTLSRDRKEPQP